VYSRATGRLFVVGGRDVDTGQNLTDFSWCDVSLDTWYRVRIQGAVLGAVIAASYALSDDRLWVLDACKAGPVTLARLLRIDPATGGAQTVGEWPSLGLFDKKWLVLDQDGAVLLAASSRKLNSHVVFRVTPDAAGPSVRLARIAPHPLAVAPLVDVAGYSFVTERGQGKKELRTERTTALTGKSGNWHDLGKCL
jgi:hypothetical protein